MGENNTYAFSSFLAGMFLAEPSKTLKAIDVTLLMTKFEGIYQLETSEEDPNMDILEDMIVMNTDGVIRLAMNDNDFILVNDKMMTVYDFLISITNMKILDYLSSNYKSSSKDSNSYIVNPVKRIKTPA